MGILKPSPALTISEHTSIGEAIQFLTEHKAGSVIITSYQNSYKPIGIFTERDLLKWVLKFKDSNLWNVAIGTIMTKKLITISILELDKANDLMIKHNIRHVPVVYEDKHGELHLAGVVSMRDAFKVLMEENRQMLAKIKDVSDRKMLVLAKSFTDRNLHRSILSAHTNVEVTEKEDHDAIMQSSVFIFDLDHFPADLWATTLKDVLKEPSHPAVFIVFNPILHEKQNIEAILKIAKGKVVFAYPKPLNLIEYLSQLERTLHS